MQYVQSCWSTQLYSRGGGGTIYPGSRPAGVTTRSPSMVTECLLIRSMLIKMYLPLHSMCLYMYIAFSVSQFFRERGTIVDFKSSCSIHQTDNIQKVTLLHQSLMDLSKTLITKKQDEID